MITHVVLFKVSSEDAIPELERRLSDMRNRIPGLIGLEVGRDVDRSERAYDVALITRFRSKDDLAAYRQHPVHQDVVAHIRQVAQGSVVVDFES